jgi:hypothetical protein
MSSAVDEQYLHFVCHLATRGQEKDTLRIEIL